MGAEIGLIRVGKSDKVAIQQQNEPESLYASLAR
jgi:hypothetical protein